jgi:hypothetical protein
MSFEVKPVEADGSSVQVLVDDRCRRRRCGAVGAIVVVVPSQLIVRS